MLAIFDEHYLDARETLAKSEEDRETWYAENDQELLTERRMGVITVVKEEIKALADTEAQLRHERARVEGYEASLALVEPKLTLNWSISDADVLDEVVSRLGMSGDTRPRPVEASDTGTPRMGDAPEAPFPDTPEHLFDPSQSGGVDATAQGRPVVTQESVNEAYWRIYEQLSLSASMAGGLEAQWRQVQQSLDQHLVELQQLNEDFRRMDKEKERVDRSYELAKEVHDMFYPRQKWIAIANAVDYHTLQVLSSGTAWPRSNLWGFMGAFFLGFFGLIAAACVSLLCRLFLVPALRDAS